MRTRSRPRLAATVLATVAAATACATAPASTSDRTDGLVLADGYDLGGYNPITGHGEAGESKIYDGLLRLSGGDGMPTFEPALAAEMPTVSADGLHWAVKIREGVRFTDGTTLDADDVAATYGAIFDPASASPLATSLNMIASVGVAGPNLVRFDLKYPYAAMPTKLLLGIAPVERLTAGPASESTLNTNPVGTGPYKLVSLRPDQAEFEANEDYWDGAPQVKSLTVAHVPDDNARAQRLTAGEVDGANLPPRLAAAFSARAGFEVSSNTSADWRGVTLPADNPITADPAMRAALNRAVDRSSMVDHVLAGYGRPASTPLPQVYGAAYEPNATFALDRAGAEQILDDAGWRRSADGVREKAGVRAEFTIMYFPEDTLRRDLAQAFATDADRIGVLVNVQPFDRAALPDRLSTNAGLLGGGDLPFDPDPQVYSTLHSSFAQDGVGSPYDNASDYVNPVVDAALDAARHTTDPDERAAQYRNVQSAYVADPGYVMLVFLDHTYVSRDTEFTGSTPILEPHSHGAGWGPWWNLREWRRP
ncbi:ABC transporter substrate-binding protein [Rhodococcus opacus]|uniref:ABC transporter substrate-binding protein n=1 Tax=Rhodococcus opacus TaxID=37919 RepID=A0AAX3YPW1_RHOOP|nr:ABC transporter substrate-binding protein [Rhodococcus opacus]MCZ4590438.1 ABC transporter substrate-binding protein [Rhodococcus opacus]WLF51268.1 ABC transporter substrate-binding protein [Rhodococcus opacus]